MVFRPDFVLKDLDRPYFRLVAEVRAKPPSEHAAETQLKEYMLWTGCSVGLLVTAEKTLVYRNTFMAPDRDSIQMLAKVDTGQLLGLDRTPETSTELEQAVQVWLEALSRGAFHALPEDPSLRELVSTHIAPAAESTTLQAVAPRD